MYELKLLKVLGTRKVWDKSDNALKSMTINKDAKAILTDIKIYYKDFPNVEEIDWDDFYTWSMNHRHPLWTQDKKDMRKLLITNIKAEEDDETVLGRLLELALADELEETVADIRRAGGGEGIEEAEAMIAAYYRNTAPPEDGFVSMNVEELVTSVIKGDGIEWRLNDLNMSAGQLHEGDFVVVGKRPETGGTTFLTSEFTHMLSQLPKDRGAIIFNNEEGGDKIGLRLIQSALGVTTSEIEADPLKIQREWTKFLDGRTLDVYHNPHMNNKVIEGVLNANPHNYLIGLNVLDKIGGFNTQNEVSRYRELAWWGRRLADKHGSVIAICQADAEADGQRYLRGTQLYGSKTGVQGEADIQLMIGTDPATPYTRYFNVVKNKKPTTGIMQPQLRHAQFPANFDIERGRFTSATGVSP